jgi:penicillin-binding protein 1A
LGQFVFVILVLLAAGVGALAGLIFVHSTDLPQVQQLMAYRPDVMTELYADDGTLLGSFALERRVIVTHDQIPRLLKDAIVSVEDRHFESHWGVDVMRVARAALTDLLEWRKAQGASTLTMQLSRVLFLAPEKSFRRKFQEVLLAIQIERHFTKPQILTMYVNQVSLGHGNFGFAAAAHFFFGKRLEDLTLPEVALLAGLPRSPTAYSPIFYPERARQRRNLVLAAMLDNGKINEAQFRAARTAPLGLNVQPWSNKLAPYFVEDVRQFLERKYGTEAVHEKGLRVYTTVNLAMQQIAEEALRRGLHEDDKRRGWRGPVKNILKKPVLLPDGSPATLESYADPDWSLPPAPERRLHGVVTEVHPDSALVRFGEYTARVTPSDFAWTGKRRADEIFTRGDVDLFQVREIRGKSLHVALDQRPDVQGAVVVIENSTGAVKAMVGGYDFEESKYNRARQALRQAGSSFKPYVYAAALLEGARPFDLIVDAPVSFPTASGVWSPRNYDGKFKGTITLLRALAESRNIPAVRLGARVGVDKIIKICRRFGLTPRLVPNLTLALGASDLTLLEHTSAFTTFPNDGVRVAPRLVTRVTDYDGRVLEDFPPEVADVLPASIARLEVSMLREVFNSGTAARGRALAAKYPLAGKTGTTNDYVDAWFVGFSPRFTTGVWVGFDDRRSLGPKEEGARVALPIWMEVMEGILKDLPVEDFPYSPLLSKPEQVEQILASAGAERLLAVSASTSLGSGNPAPGPTSIPATRPSPGAFAVVEESVPDTAAPGAPPSPGASGPSAPSTSRAAPAKHGPAETGSGHKLPSDPGEDRSASSSPPPPAN